MLDPIALLRQFGIQPTPQRVAVVDCVLKSKSHPSAEEIFEQARGNCPTVSRATVYNTLNLLVEKKLIKSQLLREGTVVFDPNIGNHHHFIDEETGAIYDIPWESIRVAGEDSLEGFEIHEYQVILKGRRKKK